ncbi:hypothetical protein SprV_0401580400 [Sparganum proliferum]
MDLFGYMCIHESRIDRSPGTPSTSRISIMPNPTHIPPLSVHTATRSTTLSTSCIPTMLSPKYTPSPRASTSTSPAVLITEPDTDTADFLCPHCSRKFTSRIGLVGHLRIHLAETDEPAPGAPAYTRASASTVHIAHARLFTA